MAEGDTIHRLARRLAAALDAPLENAEAPARDSPLRLQRERLERLRRSRLEQARAHGKHLLLDFDAGLVLHSHLGMNGGWEVRGRGEPSRKPGRAPRLVLSTGVTEAAQFGGPVLELKTPAELRADRRLRGLGPDVLAADYGPEAAAAAFGASAGDRAIGEALLDQSLVAGIGNIFKSEGCFAAGVDPWRGVAELDTGQIAAVLGATRELMQAAVASGRQPKRIYRQAGRPCPRCGTAIRSRGQGDANRTTYWCPACQR